MEPEKDVFRRALLLEPGDGATQRVGARFLQRLDQIGLLGLRKVVVVAIESAPEPAAPFQHDGGNERSGPKAGALQDLRQQRRRWEIRRREVVADAKLPRQQPRQDRRVGRTRQRHMGHRVRRIRPCARDAIDSGRQTAAAVNADAIGSQRVDGDKDEVPRGDRLWRFRTGARGAGGRADQDDVQCGGGTKQHRGILTQLA